MTSAPSPIEEACNALISAAQALRAAARTERYRTMSGRQLAECARTGSDETVKAIASVADLDMADHHRRRP